jgi:hypothetical protein
MFIGSVFRETMFLLKWEKTIEKEDVGKRSCCEASSLQPRYILELVTFRNKDVKMESL